MSSSFHEIQYRLVDSLCKPEKRFWEKEAGSEPLVLSSIPLQDARDILGREMLPLALAEDQGDDTHEWLQNVSQLRTSASSSPREDASPSPASPEMPPLIRHRSQRVGELDSDDDFVRPGTAPTRPAKGTVQWFFTTVFLSSLDPMKLDSLQKKKLCSKVTQGKDNNVLLKTGGREKPILSYFRLVNIK